MLKSLSPEALAWIVVSVTFGVVALILIFGWPASEPAAPQQTQPPQPQPQPPPAQPVQPTPQPAPPTQPQAGATDQTAPTGNVVEDAAEEQTERRKLEDLEPWEIREIGAAYGVNMSGVVGTTFGRTVSLLVFGGAVWMLVAMIMQIVLEIIGHGDGLDYLLITTAIWFLGMGITHHLWLVNVPKLTGLITTDYFTGELHVYGAGLGIKYLWERYTQDDYIDIQADVVEKKSRFITNEGVGVSFDWSMQFTPYLPMLPLYVRTESRAISDGLEEVVEATFSSSILGMDIATVRHPETIDLIRENLLRMLEGRSVLDVKGKKMTTIKIIDAKGYPMEERFGITVELGTLSPPEFDEDYQELILGRVKAKGMRQDAEALAKKGEGWDGVSPEKALRAVMIMNKEPGVTDESFTIDLTDNAKQAAGEAAEVLRAAVPVARAMTNRGGRRGGQGGGNQTPPTQATPHS